MSLCVLALEKVLRLYIFDSFRIQFLNIKYRKILLYSIYSILAWHIRQIHNQILDPERVLRSRLRPFATFLVGCIC